MKDLQRTVENGYKGILKQVLMINKNLERIAALSYQWGRGPMGVNESDRSFE